MPIDQVAAAKAYRNQLNAQGIHYGKADKMVLAKFPGVDIDQVRQHKVGGFAKVGGAVGDALGKVAPYAAFIPGVGPLAAAGMVAGSKLMGKLNDEGGIGGTKLFNEVVAPAALTYAGGKMMQGMGGGANAAGGGAPGAFSPVGAAAPMGAPASVAANVGTQAATKAAAPGFLGGLGKLVSNPNALKAAELGVGAYGAYQQGKSEDRQQDLQEQGMERQWNWEDSERERRKRVAQEILKARQANPVAAY